MSIQGVRARENAALAAGITALALALGPWTDRAADRSFSAHMLQHLALVFVAAPLVVAGAPIRRVLASLPTAAARRLARGVRSISEAGFEMPVAAWLAWAVVLYGAHFSPLYGAALADPRIHAAEHALFFSVACWFWSPVIVPAPDPRPLPYPARIFYVFLAMPPSAFLGLALYTTSHPLYAHYERELGAAAALADQRLAGELMWLGGGVALFAALMWLVAAWGRRERRAAYRILR
ncbi:MAG: cytochrome c oxidase assembly protein [Candidatus Eremiobacteraeota bacterium]|nr:cytochrome c oxidase assembly protein [Candidatus Eremiobacteraeota bacterium]